MTMNTNIFDHSLYEPAARIAKHLMACERIVLTCHMNPDADAIGSMLALAYGLESLGKNVVLCNDSRIPDYVAWLPQSGKIYKTLQNLAFKPELAVILDCGDSKRLGDLQNEILALPSINIDHHINNPNFGSVDNWVDTNMAATGQMVAAILANLGVELKGHIADALYASISSDTGSFSYDNTSELIFLLMAHLVREGLSITRVRQYMDHSWTLQRMHLWGVLISTIRLERNSTIALVTVSLKQLDKFKANSEDLEGLVEYMRRLRGVLAVGVVREDNPKQCKVSLRSTGEINVQAMLAPLGGGGHRNAAGALLKYDLKKSSTIVLQEITKWLDANVR